MKPEPGTICSWCLTREATHACAGCGEPLCDECETPAEHLCKDPYAEWGY